MEFIIIRMSGLQRHRMFVHRSTPGLACLPVWLVMSVGSPSSLWGYGLAASWVSSPERGGVILPEDHLASSPPSCGAMSGRRETALFLPSLHFAHA